MSLFICQKCGCIENTSCGFYWGSKTIPHPFEDASLDGLALCSECAPDRFKEGSPNSMELARRCIEAFTDPGDLVLDPFAGSGTTLFTARSLGRKSLGLDNSPKYCANIQKKLEADLEFENFLNRGLDPIS